MSRLPGAVQRPVPQPQPSQLAMSVRWALAIVGRDFMLGALHQAPPPAIIFGRK